MNGILRKSFFALTLCAISASALSANVIGKWTGKMTLDGSGLKKQLKEQSAKFSGERKKQVDDRLKLVDQSIQFIDKTKIRMDIKKGGIAFIEFNRNGKIEPEWCKWVVKGNKITLNGFTGGGDSTMALEGDILNGGKKLLFDMSFIIAKQMNAQGLKSAQKPKMTLSFTKS